jgi:putative NADH-flavin reductase
MGLALIGATGSVGSAIVKDALQRGHEVGTFWLGTEQLLVDAKGESKISTQDYAVAMIDEVENPTHIRQRFTVGY